MACPDEGRELGLECGDLAALREPSRQHDRARGIGLGIADERLGNRDHA